MIAILKEQEQGQKLADLCCKHGKSDQTFYNWKSKYGDMDVDELRRLKGLEKEKATLKPVKLYVLLSGEEIGYKWERCTAT